MCVVIDASSIASVFNPKSQDHDRFIPVLKWVTSGGGKVVYGGTKYNAELRLLARYFKIIIELSKQGRVIQVPSEPVDDYAEKLKAKVRDASFNDEHLVALIAISRCRIICTNDRRAHPYLQRADLYPKGVKPPKI